MVLFSASASAENRYVAVDSFSLGSQPLALSIYANYESAKAGVFNGYLTKVQGGSPRAITIHLKDADITDHVSLSGNAASIEASGGRKLSIEILNSYNENGLQSYLFVGRDDAGVSEVASVKVEPFPILVIAILLSAVVYICTTEVTYGVATKCPHPSLSLYFSDYFACQASCS